VVDRGLDVVRLYNWHACDPLDRCAKRVLDKLERYIGALWESKLKKRGVRDNAADNNNNDNVVEGDGDGDGDGDNMNSNDGEKAGRIEVSHKKAASRISEGEAKVDDNGDISACITATEEILDDDHSAALPIAHEKNNAPTIPLSPMKAFDENMDPARTNIESPKSCKAAVSIQTLSEKINNFSANLNIFVHKTIPEQYHKSFDSIHQDQLQSDLPHKIHLEQTKSTKREGFIVRRFETTAGMGYRAQAEENAERFASLTILEEKIANAGGMNSYKKERFLAEVGEIRRMVEQERVERARQDEIVLKRLVMTRETLQRSLGSGLGLS